MNKITSFLTALSLSFVMGISPSCLALDLEIGNTDFKSLWRSISELSGSNDDALLQDKSDYGWSLFNSYDSFFEKAIDILTDKESGRLVKKIYDCQKEILKNNKKKEELNAQYFAAEDSSWNPFATTKESITADVKKLDKKNEDLRQEINRMRDQLHASLNRHGIVIDREQLDFLLSSVSGPTLSKMLLVTDSMKQILNSIEVQMKDNADNAVVKRYASIYLVTIIALRHAQDLAVEDLKQNCEKIDRLIDQAHQAIRDAKSISGYNTDKVLLSNIKLNTRTVVIAKKYKEILQNYQALILAERPNIERNIKVARNMYHTVNVASSLISIVQKSSSDYNALFKFTMPAVNEIYASSLNREFDKLSERLNQME